MKKLLKLTFLVAFIGLLMISSSAVQEAQAFTIHPRAVSLTGPNGSLPLFDWLKGSMIPVIYGMNDANFTDGTVLYTNFTTHNQYVQLLPRTFQNNSLNINLTNFNASLTSFLSQPHPLLPLSVKQLLTNLQTEILHQTTLNLNRYTSIAPYKTVDKLSHFVVILYDPDKSVINAMDTIRSNGTLTSQPFTGDEVLTSVQMGRTIDSISGNFFSKNTFSYGNGSLASEFVKFGLFLNDPSHPFLTRQLIKDLNISPDLLAIRNFATATNLINTTISNLHPVRDVNLGFTVSQMQINSLNLTRNKQNNVIISNFNVTLVENNALGITLFNDTNSNGIMDLSMNTVSSPNKNLNGTVLPGGSNEAVYRVDFKNATCVNQCFTPLTKTAGKNALTFSFDTQNVNVNLESVNQNQDEALFTNSSNIPETISNFGYIFNFTTNSTDHSANVKFSYNLGDWSNKTALQGLSLNQMFITGVKDFSGKGRVMTMDNNNAAVNTNGQSVTARRFAINAGQSPVASVSLDQLPYTWNGTTQEQAYGQTLPLLFASYLFGRVTTNGDTIRTIGGTATSTRYLYSLSYPIFSGWSIAHDPTFSMVASTSSSTSSTISSAKSGVPGFELLSLLMAVPVILLFKKKKQQ